MILVCQYVDVNNSMLRQPFKLRGSCFGSFKAGSDSVLNRPALRESSPTQLVAFSYSAHKTNCRAADPNPTNAVGGLTA